MRRRRIALALAVVAVAVAVIVSVTIVPGLLARAAAGRMAAALRTPVRVGWLWWNPLRGTWVLDRVRIAADRGPAAISARRARARIHLWDVLRGDYRIRTLALDGARLRLRATSGGWELPLPARDAAAGESTLPAVTCDWLGAPRAHVRLESREGARSRLRLRLLEASGFVAPDRMKVALWTRGRLDRGSIAFRGDLRSTPDTRRLRLRLAATGLDLARTLRLAQGSAVRDLRGRVDVHAKYEEAGPPTRVARRGIGSLDVYDLALGTPRVEAVWIRDLSVGHFDVALDRRSLGLGTVRARGTEAWLRRDGSHRPLGVAGAPDGAWTVTLARADAVDGLLHVLGTTEAESFDVTLRDAHLGRVADPETPTPFSFAATLSTGGSASGEGEIVRAPLRAAVRTRADGFALPPLLAAWRSPLRLESGEASGAVEVRFRDNGVELAGDVTLTDVKSVAPEGFPPEDVLAFKDARLRIRDARIDPPRATFDAIDISWPYVLVDRSADRIFPLTLGAAASSSASGLSALPEITIDRNHVLGGRLDFRDLTLVPPYWRSLANLTLDAREIEVPAMRAAAVQATGLVDEVSPLRVRGTVGDRTRLVAEVQRLALPPFNAYLVEGAWPYSVSSGLLSGRSEVTLERSQLEVDNEIVFSQLGLAGAQGADLIQHEIGIPLTLALALMKDYRGDIALSLPFGGDLKEPTLEFRSVVMQAIVRAIRGAVLSPLNALGRVFLRDGRIERIDLEPIPFAPGQRDLDAAGRERLAQVAHVLETHRELAVSLRGAAAAADLEHVQAEAALGTLLDDPSAEPLRAVLRARLDGTPPPSIGERDAARLDTLLAGLPWPGTALHDLALDRGTVAATTLIADHRLDPGRVSTDPPPTPAPDTLAPVPGVTVKLNEG